MKYEVILNKDLIPTKRNNYIPLDWPVSFIEVKSGVKTSDGARVMSLDEIEIVKSNLWTEYEKLQQQYKDFVINDRLRVLDFVHEDFKNLYPSKIDFTKHLRDGIILEKRDVIIEKNGRPQYVIYYYNDIKIAKITFEFTADVLNFMTRRIQRLAYYSQDGGILDSWVIADEKFDASIQYQHQKQLEERHIARQWIIDSLMSDIDRMMTVTAQQNPTMAGPLSAMINLLLVEYMPHFAAFVNAGGTYLRSKIQAETKYPLLDATIPLGGTVRDYVMDKLTY